LRRQKREQGLINAMAAKVDFTERLDPQMRRALEKQKSLLPDWPRPESASIERMRNLYDEERRFWNAEAPQLPRVREATVPGPWREIPLRFYYPSSERPLPAVIYLHGGGWILGSLDTHDKIMRLLALKTGVCVLGIDYCLAPERKFPDALEEVKEVIRLLTVEGGSYGIDPRSLALAGDSAGANLCLAACIEALAAGSDAIKGAALYYGAYGLKDSPSRRRYCGSDAGMSEADLDFYRTCLLRDPGDGADPRLDIFRADLRGLPPLFLAAAEIDPLYDDSTLLAEFLAAAQVPHELKVYPGVLHGFLHLSRMLDLATSAIDDGAAWLRQKLAS
jgi:acetyl esterase